MPAARLEFRILGPLEVRSDGIPLSTGGPKRRALLGLLLLNANRVVPLDRLLEELGRGGESAGDGPLRVQVSRLRKSLVPDGGEPRLVARAPGYLLRVEPGELDLERFEQAVADGRQAAADGDPARAAELYRGGLALWRGRPLADLEFEPLIRIEIERLEELRLTATEERIEAELAVGQHAALIPELEALTAEHPLRERLREQLMLALYRCGRQAEALDVYRVTRRMLNEDLGLVPGVALQKLEKAILEHDEALDATTVAVAPPRNLPAVCPFKGLAPFESSDAPFFFGRERLVDELVARLAEVTLVAVLGPSGSGKSSLLRAGILPALTVGALPGSEPWHQVILRPGEHPRFRTGNLSDGRRLVVAVDQFEELFTACESEEERRSFVDALVEAAWDPERRVAILIAMRADYFGRLVAFPDLAELIGAGHVLLGPMSERELRRAIEGPADRAGLVVEPELVEALVADTAGESGGLPLLSTALLELWLERDGSTMRAASYEATGRVPAAVARLAETAYGRLDGPQRRLLRGIFLRLAGDDDGVLVRRRVPLSELDVPGNSNVSRVLDMFADRRLVTVGDGTVEVAHEALLTHWPRFRDWLAEDAVGRQLHRHLRRAAAEWDAAEREPAELYRGARLSAALEWETDHGDQLNDLEHEFLADSQAAAQRDEEHQQRTNRRLRSLLGGAVVLLVLTLAAGAFALDQRSQARSQATAAEAQQLGAQALLQPALDRSLLLAREAVNLDDSLGTRSYLLAALLRAPAAIKTAQLGGPHFFDEALSPDGRTLAVRGDDGNLTYYDTRTLKRKGRVPFEEGHVAFVARRGPALHGLAYSPNGSTLAMGSSDGSRAILHLIRKGGPRFPRVYSYNTSIPDLAFSPDGRTLATGEVVAGAVNPQSEVIVLRSPGTGKPERQSKPTVGGRLVGYTPDGRYLLVARTDAATSILLDSRTLKTVRTIRLGAPAALAPRAPLAVFGHTDGSVTLLDLSTGKATTLSGQTGSPVDSLSFSANGQRLATGDDNGTIGIWNVRAGTLDDVYHGDSASVQAVRFSPDGRTLYSASSDSSLIAWDVSGTRQLGRPFLSSPNPRPGFIGAAVSPDGSTFAASPGPNQVELWNSTTRTVFRRLRGPVGDPRRMRFSPDGTLLGVSGTRDDVVWDVRTGKITRVLPVGSGDSALAFSPDGHVLAVNGAVDAIILYDLRTGDRLVSIPGGDGTPQDIDFSPDGKLLASATLTGDVQLWEVATGHVLAALPNPPNGQLADFAVRFSPDGNVLAAGDSSGNVVLWDVATHHPLGRPLAGQNGALDSVAFDPSGKTLVTMSDDGNLRLWDVATHTLIGAPIPVSAGGGSVQFFPDGKRVLGLFGDGTGVIWNVDPAAWTAQACRVANRNLTPAEWSEFLDQRPYSGVCPLTPGH